MVVEDSLVFCRICLIVVLGPYFLPVVLAFHSFLFLNFSYHLCFLFFGYHINLLSLLFFCCMLLYCSAFHTILLLLMPSFLHSFSNCLEMLYFKLRVSIYSIQNAHLLNQANKAKITMLA